MQPDGFARRLRIGRNRPGYQIAVINVKRLFESWRSRIFANHANVAFAMAKWINDPSGKDSSNRAGGTRKPVVERVPPSLCVVRRYAIEVDIMTDRERAAIREGLAAGNENMRAEHRLAWNCDDAAIARRVYADYMMLRFLEEDTPAS